MGEQDSLAASTPACGSAACGEGEARIQESEVGMQLADGSLQTSRHKLEFAAQSAELGFDICNIKLARSRSEC
jgi:hypothetical protein